MEEIRRIAFAEDCLPSRDANLSPHRKTLALRLVELSEKRNVENCREPSLRNGGRLRRRNRFHFLDLLRQFRHIRASRDDCLGTFVSLNPPHGQSHDEARLARFRFDFDLTAMPVSYDALAYRKAETFSRTDALCGEERLKDMRTILRWDAGAVVDDFNDSLVVVASGLDSDLTAAIHRIRCVIEQVDPYLREFTRIAAHVAGFARKILGDTNVREFAI